MFRFTVEYTEDAQFSEGFKLAERADSLATTFGGRCTYVDHTNGSANIEIPEEQVDALRDEVEADDEIETLADL